MSELPPRDVRRFELLQVASIVIGLLHSFAAAEGALMPALVIALFILVLTFWVSCGRSNLGRWLLLAMFVAGAGLMLADIEGALNRGYPAIMMAVTLLQAAALALLFTHSSSAWLRRRSLPR